MGMLPGWCSVWSVSGAGGAACVGDPLHEWCAVWAASAHGTMTSCLMSFLHLSRRMSPRGGGPGTRGLWSLATCCVSGRVCQRSGLQGRFRRSPSLAVPGHGRRKCRLHAQAVPCTWTAFHVPAAALPSSVRTLREIGRRA